MIQKPIEIIKALIHDVLVERPLVLDDYRAAVLVDSERVHSAAMLCARGIFACEKPYAEESVQMSLNRILKRLLQRNGGAVDFLN